MQLEIRPPIGNTRGPVYVDSLLRAIHRGGSSTSAIALQLHSYSGTVGMGAELSDDVRILFLQELQDAYPGTTIRKRKQPDGNRQHLQDIHLQLQPHVLRMRTYEDFLDVSDGRQFTDPMAGLLSAIRTGHSGKLECHIELAIRPARQTVLRDGERILQRLKNGFASTAMRQRYVAAMMASRWFVRFYGSVLGRIARTSKTPTAEFFDKLDEPLFECHLKLSVSGDEDLRTICERRIREIAGTFGRFASDASFAIVPRLRSNDRGFLLTSKEIATMWHPLTASGDAVSRMQRATFREVEPPVVLASRKEIGGATVLGRAAYRQQRNLCHISSDDLRRHMIAIGKTGCGKSTFLFNMVRQQMEANRGVVLIDPHGQLAEEVLDVVPKSRTNDVIYFDASDRVAPVGFNPMAGPAGTDPTLIADGVLTSFKNVFGFDEGSAPRLLHIFRNCLLSLIGTPHASLMNVQRMLVDATFRKTVVAQVQNDTVREFWLTEFNRWNERDRTQYVASLQNKLGAFLTNQRLRAILEAGQEGIQLRQIMDRSGILICNLSKGTFGHDASTLLGSLLLSSLQVAAMSRADISESERTDCVIVVDEFHSYLAEGNSTMADALAESRKYRTSYVLSTQMLDGQLDRATLAGVLGNCGSTLCMTVGPRDAELLSGLLGSGLTPEDLMRIPKYHGYLRMLIDGAPHTFSMTTMPPPKYTTRRAATIRRVSRERYGRTQSESKAMS